MVVLSVSVLGGAVLVELRETTQQVPTGSLFGSIILMMSETSKERLPTLLAFLSTIIITARTPQGPLTSVHDRRPQMTGLMLSSRVATPVLPRGLRDCSGA